MSIPINSPALFKEIDQVMASLDQNKVVPERITQLHQKIIDTVFLLRGEELLRSISNHQMIQSLEEIRQYLETTASRNGIQLPATLRKTLRNRQIRIAQCILSNPSLTRPGSPPIQG